MDFFAIAGAIARNKVIAIPISILTLAMLVYVIVVKPTTYSASASVLFAGPPGPPTQAEIAADPKLAKINASNTLLSYSDLVQVADVSLELLNSSASQQAMTQGAVTPQYKAALSTAFGMPPIIDITGSGSSAAQAISNANIVAKQIAANLTQTQINRGIDPYYTVKTEELVTPVSATKVFSGKIRSAIAYLAGGIILLLVLVSIREGRRRGRNGRDYSDGLSPSTDEPQLGRGDAARRHALEHDQRRALSDAQRRYPPNGVEAGSPHDMQRNSYINYR